MRFKRKGKRQNFISKHLNGRSFFALVVSFAIFVQVLLFWNYTSKLGTRVADDSNDNYVTLVNNFAMETEADNKDESDVKTTIAYAVSLTGCQAAFQLDGAAVLKHSIHLASYPKNKDSKYQYKMFVFVHPSALECIDPFHKLGYEVLVKETPINATEIKTEFYREHVVKSGCCGDKEFLKLYAYTLTDYPIVVHLDLDSLIVQPLDDLFDAMLLQEKPFHEDGQIEGHSNDYSTVRNKIPVMYGATMPENIEAFYTRDYNLVNAGHKYPGVQGGFLVIKPNPDYFEEYKRIIIEGDFKKGSGWAGKYGGYFGAQQIQGICSYFFDGIHPGTAVELNRCFYNSMVDSPYQQNKKDNSLHCRDGKDTCEDCRGTDFDLIKSVHFTLCAKPWVCPTGKMNIPLCKSFHNKWFSVRKDFEIELGTYKEDTKDRSDIFHEYCKGNGQRNYPPIAL